MSDAGGLSAPGSATVTNDERLTNTNGTLVSVRLGEDERRALRWLSPLLIFVGFNLALSLVLYFEWQRAATNYALVYSHQLKEEAYLAAHGVDVTKFGDALPEP